MKATQIQPQNSVAGSSCVLEDQAVLGLVATAFPADAVEELSPDQDEPFDSVENEQDIARVDPGEESIQQDVVLDEVGEKS